MDNTRGSFDEVEPSDFKEMIESAMKNPKDKHLDKVFHVGEEVQIKASKFIIRSLDHFTGIVTLKLLPEKRF